MLNAYWVIAAFLDVPDQHFDTGAFLNSPSVLDDVGKRFGGVSVLKKFLGEPQGEKPPASEGASP